MFFLVGFFFISLSPLSLSLSLGKFIFEKRNIYIRLVLSFELDIPHSLLWGKAHIVL